LHDPYIRTSHQGGNLVELLALIASAKDPADEATFKLFTLLEADPEYQRKQLQMLGQIIQGADQQGIKVEVAKDPGGHDRWIRTDNGWRINLGRGLDIFQKQEGGWFDFGSTRQEFRQVGIRRDIHPGSEVTVDDNGRETAVVARDWIVEKDFATI